MTQDQEGNTDHVTDDRASPQMTPPPSRQGWRRFLLSERAMWSTVVEILQICSSTLVFLVLARVFTEEVYGIMNGSMGAVAPTLALSSLGTHVLLTRRAARSEDLGQAWRRALTIGLASPTLAAIVLLAIHPLLFPQGNVPWTVFALFAIAGLPFFWLSEMVGFLPIGLGDMRTVAVIRFATLMCRVVALGWFLLFSGDSLVEWAGAHTVSLIAASILGVTYVSRKYGLRPGLGTGIASDVKEGLPFSLSGATESVFDGSDRVLLLRYGLDGDAGIYGLGGRITQFGYAPIKILLRTRDAELHRAGGDGVGPAFDVAKKMFLPALALGCGAAAGLWIFAPLVPLVFGEKWEEAVPAIRLLAFLPGIRSVQYLIGNTITASDHQPWRFAVTAIAAVLNLVLNIIYLPTGTWRTAVVTTFISEVFLISAMAFVVWYWLRRESAHVSES